MPSKWLSEIFTHRIDLKCKTKNGYIPVPVKYAGNHPFAGIELDAKSKAKLRLLISIPEKYRKSEYTIAIRQLWEKQEVGRISWKIVSKQRKNEIEKRFSKLT